MTTFVKTLKVRVKDKHSAVLTAMARNVNTTWNYCNEISQKALKDRNEWLSGYELNSLLAIFGIGSATTGAKSL